MYESSIEKKFCRKLLGWAAENNVQMKLLKLNHSGNRGWPDRLVLWSGANTLFIEFKRPGETSRPLQIFVQDELRSMGFAVDEHDNVEEALEYVKAKIRTSGITDKIHAPGGEGGEL